MGNEVLDVLTSDPGDLMRRFNSDLQHSTDFQRHYSDKWYRYYRKYRGKHDAEFLKYRGDKFTIFVPLIFSLIENIVPRFVLGTFGSYPYINVVPNGPEDIPASKKAEQLLNTQLAQDNVLVKIPGWFKQFSMYGTSPAKVRWKEDRVVIPTRNGDRQFNRYIGPTLEPMDVMDLKVDPKATDEGIPSAGYLIHTILLREDEMMDRVLRAKQYGYDFSAIDIWAEGRSPDQDLINKFQRESSLGLTTRESPDRKYWRFDEYWTKDALVTILNKRHIIRRVRNAMADYPFINLNRNALLGEYYGIGDIESIEDLMDEINYIRNMRLDNLDLQTNGMFLIERSAQVNSEELLVRAGKGIYTNDINGVKQLVFADTTGAARMEENLLKNEMQEVSGLIDMMKGQMGRGDAGMPAAGMAMLIEGASYRIKLGLMMIEHMGIRQIGDKFMRLNYLNLPADYNIRITGSNDWLGVKNIEEIFGNYDFIPSGSSEFLNKETLRQSVMQLYNLLAKDPGTDQAKLKKLLAMAFGGRMVESILLSPDSEGKEPSGDDAVGDGSQAQSENSQMLEGVEVPVVGDAAQHIPIHEQVMSSPEFASLNQGTQGIFGRHVEGHKRAAGPMTGAPLENPERTAEGGPDMESMMKTALQKPTAG